MAVAKQFERDEKRFWKFTEDGSRETYYVKQAGRNRFVIMAKEGDVPDAAGMQLEELGTFKSLGKAEEGLAKYAKDAALREVDNDVEFVQAGEGASETAEVEDRRYVSLTGLVYFVGPDPESGDDSDPMIAVLEKDADDDDTEASRAEGTDVWCSRESALEALDDYADGRVIVTRMDTGEVTEDRSMTQTERQMTIW